jgi:hypothetical protein
MIALGTVEGAALPIAPSAPGAADGPPLDDTGDGVPDTAATVAQALSKHAGLALLAQQARQQEVQGHLDRMKADFNQAQEERSEMLREMNALRDMALEQAKKDDEVLKKYIAMI